MENAIKWMDNEFFKQQDKIELNNIYQESLDIINNSRKLLKEDERRPIEGKIQLFKTKYKNIYYTAHENFVGKNVNWGIIEDIENSSAYQKLGMLSQIIFINPSKFREIKIDLYDIKGLRCNSFSADELDTNYHCNHCMFPQGLGKFSDIGNKLDEILVEISKLFNSWEAEIITTINDNKLKLNQLESSEQDIIDGILVSQKLPETIDFNIISAINNLLEDVEIKEVNFDDLYATLTSERDTLKTSEILDKVEDYIKNIVSDTDNARIKLIRGDN